MHGCFPLFGNEAETLDDNELAEWSRSFGPMGNTTR
jgi:hypothetical protein